jgi:CheY-like chemotaxis protein
MPRVNDCRVVKCEQDLADRRDQRLVVTAGKIRSANRSGKQRVADEQVFSSFPLTANLQADAAGTVPWRMMRPRLAGSESNRLARRVEDVNRRWRLAPQAEHLTRFDRPFIEKQIVGVEVNRHVQGTFRRCHAGDVIDVRVRQQDVANRKGVPLGKRQQAADLVARIDEHGLTRRLAADNEAVFHEGTNGLSLNYHDQPMILAVLDDLMFTSKIKTTASRIGVAVTFARSADVALSEMRNAAPSLVILDLNSTRANPLGLVASMKQDPALSSVPTVGYVSHVQTDVIEAARRAGVGEVLARSAFTERLADILSRQP